MLKLGQGKYIYAFRCGFSLLADNMAISKDGVITILASYLVADAQRKQKKAQPVLGDSDEKH